MKGKRIIIWTVILAIVVAIIVFVSKKASAADTDNNGSTSGGSGSSGGSSTSNDYRAKLDYTKVLKKGSGYISNNAEVKELQRILNRLEPANPLSIDGFFGPKTEAKLIRVNDGFNQTTLAQITNQQVGLNDGMLGWTRFF